MMTVVGKTHLFIQHLETLLDLCSARLKLYIFQIIPVHATVTETQEPMSHIGVARVLIDNLQ